jgi:dihydropteroate synthase
MNYVRKRFPWIFRGAETPLGARTLISAVLDVSSAAIPGKPDPDLLLARAEELANLGADFVDVCALPVRPSGKRISADDELQRIVPTIRKLRAAEALPFFVTTYNSETAARSIELGAAGIHDPSGITIDALISRTLGNSDAALIIGHGPSGAESWPKPRHIPHVVESVTADLESAVKRALSGGVDRRRIVLSPGPGLGKRPDQSLELLERLSAFSGLGQPLAVSLAGDLFLTETVRAPAPEWDAGAAAAAALAVRNGVHLIRTTHFGPVKAALRLTDRVVQLIEGAAE